jgi:CHASE2 domain-containing sensor protein/tRNA A-37 threonylcarbamoyl transferase component Bud32
LDWGFGCWNFTPKPTESDFLETAERLRNSVAPPSDRQKKTGKTFQIALGLGITALVAFLFFLRPAFLEPIHSQLYDLSLKARGGAAPPPEVLIVAIDDASVAALGRWPWPRSKMAELVDILSRAGAKVIALDVVFLPAEGERTSGNDRLLGEAAQKAGQVILPFYFTLGKPKAEGKGGEIPPPVLSSSFLLFDDPKKFSDFPPPLAGEIFFSVPEIVRGARALGHINALSDTDGRVRWDPLIIQYQNHYYPAFSLQVAGSAMGLTRGDMKVNVGRTLRLGNVTLPTDTQGKMLIPYYGGNQSIPHRPVLDVLSGRIPPEAFKDKIILVGVTAAGAYDFLATPFSSRFSGVEKHAQTVAAILQGRFISRPSWVSFVEFGLLLSAGLLLSFLLPGRRPPVQWIVCLAGLLGLGVLMFGGMRRGVWVQVFYPALAVILPTLLAAVRGASATEKEATLRGEATAFLTPERRDPTLAGGTVRMEPGSPLKEIGRYEIIGELGHGAMGVVYKGRDPIIDRLVAVKTIRFDRLYEEQEIQGLKDRFFKESQAAGKLAHPNIVTIFDVGEYRGVSYMAMEYVEGEVLSRFTPKDQLLQVEEVLGIIVQAAEALDFAHQRGIVHRDIKPANIMRTSEGQIKVMDFGIAKLPSSTLTQDGSVLGTPAYMSPEQIQGKELDGRSDLFSLGSILYELLTGIKPFRGDNLSALNYQINHENPPPASPQNPLAPPAVDEILKKILAKNPGDRYARGKEFAQALRGLLQEMKKTPPQA